MEVEYTEQESFKTFLGRKGKPVRAIKYTLDSNGCHICISHKPNSNGYHRIRVRHVLMLMHRYIWEKYNGPIPEGLVVCHKCDNPRCINPEHFFIGTLADNNHDMFSKGRGIKFTPEVRAKISASQKGREGAKGSANGNSRLTEAQVVEIRERGLSETQTTLAREYKVDRKLILLILRREVWKHV